MPFFKILKIVWSFLIDGIRNQIILNPAYATNFPAELHKSHKRIQLSKFQTDIIINILDYLQGIGKLMVIFDHEMNHFNPLVMNTGKYSSEYQFDSI